MSTLSRVIDSVLNTAETISTTATETADERLRAITNAVIAIVGLLVLLIAFALNPTYALGLIALVIVGAWILGIDIGGGSSNDGPRR